MAKLKSTTPKSNRIKIEIHIERTEDGLLVQDMKFPNYGAVNYTDAMDLNAMLILQTLRKIVHKRTHGLVGGGKAEEAQDYLHKINIVCSDILQTNGYEKPADIVLLERLQSLVMDMSIVTEESVESLAAMNDEEFKEELRRYAGISWVTT